MPAEADRIAQALCKDLAGAAVELRAPNDRLLIGRIRAGVAGAADGDVHHVVRPDGDGALVVLAAVPEGVHQLLWLSEGTVGIDVGRVEIMDGRQPDLLALQRDTVNF